MTWRQSQLALTGPDGLDSIQSSHEELKEKDLGSHTETASNTILNQTQKSCW